MKSRIFGFITGFVIFAAGTGAGWLLATKTSPDLAEQFARMQPIRETAHSYDFIDPLLTCMFPEGDALNEYRDFENRLQTVLQDFEEQGQLSSSAYYFRDLDHGRWVGIREEEMFEPASLFKVPVMMAYYKAADTQPDVLEVQIPYTETAAAGATSNKLVVGQSYTVDELINTMIIESDNVALNLLLSRLREEALQEIFIDLGVPFPEGQLNEPYTISPRKYSLFFRVLYNGTYISPARSEQALKLLSQTTFDYGLSGVLPASLKIAHKFGERRLYDAQGQPAGYELHDCGIVYYPEHPYFLCVFTQGNDLVSLTQSLRELSDLTYAEMGTLYASDAP